MVSSGREKPIRKLHRELGMPVAEEMALQDRSDGLVRMSLMRSAVDEYPNGPPDAVLQRYYPPHNVVLIDMPEPGEPVEREPGNPLSQLVRLQDRSDRLVRMTLMKRARDQYVDAIPSAVMEWYYPSHDVVVIELPEAADHTPAPPEEARPPL